jgi:DNA-binding transcriptional LysR family regulator
MPRTIDADSQIGRRLKLRDLHLFFTVVESRSMAKAAARLGISQPAVSEVIADLEHTLGVRLFDRSPQGVEPTSYGQALLKRGRAAFDELKQGVRDIEFLADPAVGELTIGFREAIAVTVLPQLIERFSERYPRVVIRIDAVPAPGFKFPGLHDRTYDLVFARIRTPFPDDAAMNDLKAEILFDDPLVVVAGINSHWVRRRKVDLADLFDEPWILSRPNTSSYECVAAAFKAKGLGIPTSTLLTYSMELRARLSARGRFITVVPKSLLRRGSEGFELKMLPVEMPPRPWPITIFTLKNRTLSPVVERFINCAREVAKEFSAT